MQPYNLSTYIRDFFQVNNNHLMQHLYWKRQVSTYRIKSQQSHLWHMVFSHLQEWPGYIVSSIPDHHNKVNNTIRQVTWIFLVSSEYKIMFTLYGSLLSVQQDYV